MTDDPPQPDTAHTPGASDPTETFETVVALLERWDPAGLDNENASGRLQRFLDRELNDDAESVLDRDIVERRHGSNAADLSVNGEIGIALVGELRQTTVDDVNVRLSLLAEWYNFLVVYWLEPSPESTDYRRTVEWHASDARLGLSGLRFVSAGPDGDGGPDWSATQLLRPSTAALGVALALALAGGTFVARTLSVTTGPVWVLLAGTGLLFLCALAFGTLFAVQ